MPKNTLKKIYKNLKTSKLLILFGFLFIFNACQKEETAIPLAIPERSGESSKAMIVSAHKLATDAGLSVMKQGGNAVDGIVATQFALAVVFPRAGNIAGGGFAVIRTPNETTSIDFREKAPIDAHKDMYLDSVGNVVPGLSTEGGLAVGVPGSVDGLLKMVEKYGKIKDLSIHLAPAIEYAEKGFTISQSEADRLNRYEDLFDRYNKEDYPYKKDGSFVQGDIIKQPQLAKTLKLIRDKGRDGFYKGVVSASIIKSANQYGGILKQSDFDKYEAKWRTPISFDYLGHEVHCMAPPSSGGLVLRQMFEMLEEVDLSKIEHNSVDYIHTIAEIERRAYADRAKYLGDVDHVKVPMEELMDSSYIEGKWKDFDKNKATSSGAIFAGKFELPESFETTHTSAIDNEGNAVSLTTTLNGNYGSKVFAYEAGCFLNNEMDDFSAKPGVPNQFGLVGNEQNAVASEKRMLSSMTPTIIEKDGEIYMVLGSPGGSTIITGVFQVILNVMHKNMPIEEAIKSGRFHHQWLPDAIMVEEEAFSKGVLGGLKEKGHDVVGRKYLAIVKAIMAEDGKFKGSGDPRNADDHTGGY